MCLDALDHLSHHLTGPGETGLPLRLVQNILQKFQILCNEMQKQTYTYSSIENVLQNVHVLRNDTHKHTYTHTLQY